MSIFCYHMSHMSLTFVRIISFKVRSLALSAACTERQTVPSCLLAATDQPSVSSPPGASKPHPPRRLFQRKLAMLPLNATVRTRAL